MSRECIYTYIAGMYVNVRCRNVCLYTLQQCTSEFLDYWNESHLKKCVYEYVAGMYVCIRCSNVCIYTLQECMYVYVAGMHFCVARLQE